MFYNNYCKHAVVFCEIRATQDLLNETARPVNIGK